MTHRRDFLKSTAAIMAGSLLTDLELIADPKKGGKGSLKKLGVQLFSIPRILEKDFAGTMKMLARIGYKEVEFYGPYPFSAQADKDRWSTVSSKIGFSGSGFFNLSLQQAKKILNDNGISAPSIHVNIDTLRDAMNPLAEAANILGTEYVVLPSAATQSTVDGAKALAEEFNKIGAAAQKLGIKFAYHNHGNGLQPTDGIVPFDLILEKTDPKLVFFEMDIFWMTAAGVDTTEYLDKYPGRFRMMHVKDMSRDARFSGDGGDSNQWLELFPFIENVGSGVMDMKKILTHAKMSGVEHFFVERENAPNALEDLKKSYSYLSTLELGK